MTDQDRREEQAPETPETQTQAVETTAPQPSPETPQPAEVASQDAPEQTAEAEASFAEMFEASEADVKPRLQVGDKVSGTIVSITDSQIFIDTGTKMEGVVDRTELEVEPGVLGYREGEQVELYVVSVESGAAMLSKALTGQGGLALLQEAFDNKLPVEGKVQAQIKGGFQIEVLKRRGFCPASQMDVRFVDNPEALVGETLRFRIIKFEDKGRNIVLSRRQLLEDEQKEVAAAFLEKLEAGQEYEGRVVRLMPFGAFIELNPGVEGMAHVSELSWSRVDKPEDAVAVGDTVKVQVLDIKKGEKGGPRIGLTLKLAGGDPWLKAPSQFKEGERVMGKVTRLAKFGAFVEIAPGLEGLVHISEMSYLKRVNKPEDVVQPGEQVECLIKELDPERRRLGLSLRDAEGDPWAGAEERFAKGALVSGVVEKRAEFGLFIQLEPGVTGLMPKSRMARAKDAKALEQARPGDPVQVLIEEIMLAERKMTLAPAEMAEPSEEARGEWKKYARAGSDRPAGKPDRPRGGRENREPREQQQPAPSGFGSLGDALQAAMQKKKS